MPKPPKRPRDMNQLAHLLVGMATGQVPKDGPGPSEPMSALKRAAGSKGGRVRARRLTAKQRAEIGRKGAAARWKKRRAREGA